MEQKVFLFEGSLRENIALDRQSISDHQLWQALQGAHIASLVRERGGLSFLIKDDGGNLSEGQKQRINFARVLLHLRPFILLDEPFAALDNDSVHYICKTLNQLKPDHAIVVVSHFVPESLKVDRVLNFDVYLEPARLAMGEGIEEYSLNLDKPFVSSGALRFS